jgi:putative peptide zinc metalloprotease protein
MREYKSVMTFPRKLRHDLTVSEQRTVDETIFIVKNPVTGAFFRLHEAEWYIARQCDGSTSLEIIRQRTEQKFAATLPLEDLAAFVNKLEKTGLLDTGRSVRRQKKHRERRVRGNVLLLRFKLLDPDAILNRLERKVRFCFTPYFLLFSAAMILLATGIVATNLNEIIDGIGKLYSLSALPVIIAVIFLVISAHEFAHGFTCKHFGGEVREMGFLLIYLQPAFYCNVSDAWLFPEKSKRLWVSFAGPYFELFLWAVATLLWRLTEADTVINYVSLIVMASSGIKTLFNFNPLIKLDGYYLLSDYLDVPNLRKKAFRYIGEGMKKWTGLGVPAEQEIVTAREHKVCLTYGLVAAVCSFSVLGLALAKVGTFLIEQSQPVAFMLFSGLLGTKLRRRFRKFFGRASGPADLSDDDDEDFDTAPAEPVTREAAESRMALPEEARTPAPIDSKTVATARFNSNAPTPAAESKTPTPVEPKTPEAEPKAPERVESPKPERSESKKKDRSESRKRKRSVWKGRIELAILAGLIVAILFVGRTELRIVGAFSVLPWENADVRSAVAGIIDEIYVDEGDEVKAGDLIARLSDFDLRADLGRTEALINQTRARLQLLETGPTEDEIDVARTAVSRAEDKVKYAQARLARDKGLFEQNLVPQATFEDTEEMSAVAVVDLDTARTKLKVLLGGTRPEEIDATRASLEGLETQRRYLQEQLRLLKIVSPATGIVATPSRQLKEMKRQLVNKGDLIAKVFDYKTVIAEMIIPEKEIADIKVGQEVVLKARSYPNETFHGTVTAIATAASGSSSSTGGQMPGAPSIPSPISTSSKTLLVTTEIQNPSLLLKAQMTGQAKILCGERRFVDLMTRRLARTVKVEFWSWW